MTADVSLDEARTAPYGGIVEPRPVSLLNSDHAMGEVGMRYICVRKRDPQRRLIGAQERSFIATNSIPFSRKVLMT